MRWAPWFVRLAVGAVLAWFAWQKLSQPAEFLKAVREYGILPEEPPLILNLTAAGIPWLEATGALCLATGLLRRGAATVVGAFLLLFTGAVLWRTFQVMETTGQAFHEVAFDCGCGTGVVVIWEKTITNLMLFAAVLYAGFRGTSRARRATPA